MSLGDPEPKKHTLYPYYISTLTVCGICTKDPDDTLNLFFYMCLVNRDTVYCSSDNSFKFITFFLSYGYHY